jgi:hypothetical protein
MQASLSFTKAVQLILDLAATGKEMTPAWVPAPTLLAYIVGITLLAAGVGLMIRRNGRTAAAIAGTVLLLLTIFFYVPILILEIRSPLAVEGVNYVGDTLTVRSDSLAGGLRRGLTVPPL